MTTTFDSLLQQLIQEALKPLQEENQALCQELKETQEQVWALRQEFESLFQAQVAAPTEEHVEETQEEIQEEVAVEETIGTVQKEAPEFVKPEAFSKLGSSDPESNKEYEDLFGLFPDAVFTEMDAIVLALVELKDRSEEEWKRNYSSFRNRIKPLLFSHKLPYRPEAFIRTYAVKRDLNWVILGKYLGLKKYLNGYTHTSISLL